MKDLKQYVSQSEKMSSIDDYISESEADGKNGHYDEFVDEDTGEIVKIWVNDPDPEELEAQARLRKAEWKKWKENKKKEREIIDKSGIDDLLDEILNIQQQLKDLHDEFRQISIDQEEEVGGLYAQGKEKEAEELAQEYGERFNKNQAEQEKLHKELAKAKKKHMKLHDKVAKELEKLWDEK